MECTQRGYVTKIIYCGFLGRCSVPKSLLCALTHNKMFRKRHQKHVKQISSVSIVYFFVYFYFIFFASLKHTSRN